MTWKNIIKKERYSDSKEDMIYQILDIMDDLKSELDESVTKSSMVDLLEALIAIELVTEEKEGEPTPEEPKKPKAPQSKEIDNFLEEIEDFATQRFEQAYSPDDDDSIETAQEYYKMLEYLETTNYIQWDLREIKRKYPVAFMMVEEAFGWTGRLR
tara:strand:+ start:280 stop:747 length:468 start_codon:yes stop_codon:yes gene_type:complete